MNYLVWLRGLKGPSPQLHLRNPRESIDWQLIESSIITIIELPEEHRHLSLSEAAAAYPCPEVR